MADKKKDKEELDASLHEEEIKISEIVNRFNTELISEMNGKPYLLVLATLHEVGREGGKSKLATQWNWRSNINASTEGRPEKDVEAGKIMMKFLTERIPDVVNHPEGGIKKKYNLD
ncbi:MAG: hypothetical protein NTV88_05635 [Candidatus Micrarchaeota archaeon]|nr:hypothetical protein [Candidatus Micrarchaeota archaeon]